MKNSKRVFDQGDALAAACEQSDVTALQKMLADGFAVNSVTSRGETALMVASRTGQLEMVKILLAAGADPLISNASVGNTPFMIACFNFHENIAETLWKSGSDLLHKNEDNSIAWTWATRFPNLLEKILSSEIELDLNCEDNRGTSLWFSALLSKSPEKIPHSHEFDCVKSISLLIAAGADVNYKNRNGRTALMAAELLNYRGVIELLLKHGADASIESNDGYRAVNYARLRHGEASLDAHLAVLELLEMAPHKYH